MCLLELAPGSELSKSAAGRCCTVQLLAGDDLQSTHSPGTLPPLMNPAICYTGLSYWDSMRNSANRQQGVQKVRKVFYQNICLAFLQEPTQSWKIGLGQVHPSVICFREIMWNVLSGRAKQIPQQFILTLRSMKNEGSHKLQKSIWDKDMAKPVKKIYRAKTNLIYYSNRDQARDGL